MQTKGLKRKDLSSDTQKLKRSILRQNLLRFFSQSFFRMMPGQSDIVLQN